MSKKINKGRLFRNIILIVLLLGSVGLYLSNRFVKTKGFEGIGDFFSNYQTNKSLADGVVAEEMQLLLSDSDYEFLKGKRQESLDRGIQVNIGDNYVKCKILYKGDTIKGEMRLKGHMTDHLEGDKWSFRVKSEDEVLGMYRFSLQNPATRNYAYEWIYHELLANEDVIHLKYDFLRLKLNDKDLGIYAIEEHFGQHVLRDNQRPPGAILRWNPELYWEGRMDELAGVYLDEQYSKYSSSFPEPYDKGVVKRDPELIRTYNKGAQLLEAFRRSEKTTSEVFDIDKMAKFHAVIDLVGGYHSLDWSDVKFYYNSKSGKIEPVGYESFSVRETVKIAGQRTPEDYASVGYDYHDKLFADPQFFAAYIQNLERICDEAYFSDFTKKIEAELNLKRGVLADEFAYIKFSFQPYYDNIELIRHNIELPKPLHAFLASATDSTVTISVSPVSDFPIEIIKLEVNEKRTHVLDSSFVLPPKARNTFAHYFELEFKHEGKKLKDLVLWAKIPGGTTIFKVDVSDLPPPLGAISTPVISEEGRKDSTLVWVNDSVAFLPNQHTTLDGSIVIEKGKTLVLNAGQSLDFASGGVIVVNGSLKLLGSGDNQVHISSQKSKLIGTCILLENGNLIAVNTAFRGLYAPLLKMDKANAQFEKCIFADSKAVLIHGEESQLSMISCASGRMDYLGTFDRCLVRIKNFTAKNGTTFIASHGSDIDMHQSEISGYEQVSVLDYSSDFSSWGSVFEDNNYLAQLDNNSHFKTFSSQVVSGENGFKIGYHTHLSGESSYLLYKTPSEQLKSLENRMQ